jgi:phage terminase large subunit
MVLPHDGAQAEATGSVRGASSGRGLRRRDVPNQGKGAAMQRVEAARRLFPSIWFNDETDAPGEDAGRIS